MCIQNFKPFSAIKYLKLTTFSTRSGFVFDTFFQYVFVNAKKSNRNMTVIRGESMKVIIFAKIKSTTIESTSLSTSTLIHVGGLLDSGNALQH